MQLNIELAIKLVLSYETLEFSSNIRLFVSLIIIAFRTPFQGIQTRVRCKLTKNI